MEALKKIYKKHGFDLIIVPTKEEALCVAMSFIQPKMSIGLGGSMSVKEIGLYEYLRSRTDISLYNQYEEGINMDENMHRRRQGLISDLYITGTNALTKDGILVNADGSGNRVAAQIFGPKKVLIIAGINKLVENVEEGFVRIRDVASPKNIERINAIAIRMGKEPHYTMSNIGKKFVYINGDELGRTTIILVEESLGF